MILYFTGFVSGMAALWIYVWIRAQLYNRKLARVNQEVMKVVEAITKASREYEKINQEQARRAVLN